jgi:hypothetical protein
LHSPQRSAIQIRPLPLAERTGQKTLPAQILNEASGFDARAAAYGWPVDLSDEQLLERLLALNLERAAAEAKAQESPKRKSAQRDKAEHELI